MAGFDKVRPGFFLALRRQARDVTFDIADELRRWRIEFDKVPVLANLWRREANLWREVASTIFNPPIAWEYGQFSFQLFHLSLDKLKRSALAGR
jgi:hypothetical protein